MNPRFRPISRDFRKDAVNPPNLITSARILLIPFVIILMSEDTARSRAYAAGLFTLVALTDALDGWLARRRGEESVLGKFLDPLADKLLVLGTLIELVARHRVAAWVVMIIVARELAVTSLRTIAISEGVIIGAGTGGKWKTAIQMIALFLLILHDAPHLPSLPVAAAGTYLLYGSLVLAVTSAGEYVRLLVRAVEAKHKNSC